MPGPYGGGQPPKTPTIPWWKKLRDVLTQPSTLPVGGTPSPYQPSGNVIYPPAWQRPKPPTTSNYSASPPTFTPTGSFIGGGGSVVLNQNQQATPSIIPTGSFIGGGGEFVLGPNQRAYRRTPSGPTTFIGAGGEAVRGPDTPLPAAPPTSGGGGGYSSYYRRRKGGGGRQPQYQPRQQQVYNDNAPAWSRGLANWSIG